LTQDLLDTVKAEAERGPSHGYGRGGYSQSGRGGYNGVSSNSLYTNNDGLYTRGMCVRM
jgi:hypothetical protein